MPSNLRKNTNKLMEFVNNDDILNDKDLIRDLLNYLSEAEVTEFIETYEYEWVLGEN